MNSFDKNQVSFLEELYKKKVKLHYSFFANTFPIAFHYSLLLRRNGCDPKEFVVLQDWDNFFPSESDVSFYSKMNSDEVQWPYPLNINLFYSPQINYKNEKYLNIDPYRRIKEYIDHFKDRDENVDFINFTKYRPRLIFVKKGLFSMSLCGDGCVDEYSYDFRSMKGLKIDELMPFSDFLNEAIGNGVKSIVVYTETINEARSILGEYPLGDAIVEYRSRYDLSSLCQDDCEEIRKNKVFLFFYGAPISFHFLTKPDKYIPLRLEEGVGELAITSNACLHYNRERDERHIDVISNSINAYHKEMFNVAASEKGGELLNNIRLAYNEFSRLIRHDSYFYTSEAFRRCIYEYNWYSSSLGEGPESLCVHKDENNELIRLNKNSNTNIHIHYGAGKLGIGLVLSLLKYGDNHDTIIIVIQKKRGEWIEKIRYDLQKISLKNTQDWSRDFFLIDALAIEKVGNMMDHSFVLFDDFRQLKKLFMNKSLISVSYSLNNHEAEYEFLEFLSLIRLKQSVMIYPFENNPFGCNDGSITAKLRSILKRNAKLSYVRLKADRICQERLFKRDNVVEVESESHCEVVFNVNKIKTNGLFDSFDQISGALIFTENNKRYAFLSMRKQCLLNELHFILATYGYDYLSSKKIYNWSDQYVPIIQSVLATESEFKLKIDSFISLQILRIIYSTPKNIIKNEYGLIESDVSIIYEKLREYAAFSKKRFSESREDRIMRVFNVDDVSAVQRKYHGIILKISRFVKKRSAEIDKMKIPGLSNSKDYELLIKDIQTTMSRVFELRSKKINEQLDAMQEQLDDRRFELSCYKSRIQNVLGVRDVVP